MMQRFFCYVIIVTAFASCTAAKVSVPNQFKSQATAMKVKGLNGMMINQTLKFGDYQTSRVKRGWDFTGGIQYTKFRLKPEEMVLRVFNIETDKKSFNQRNKFQYTIEDGKLMAEVFAQEKFNEKELVYKSNNPLIGDFSKTQRYEYSFSAAILPIQAGNNDPWSLVLINKYDAAKDTARRIFDRPYVETEGYATNGKENITIRPLMIRNVTTKGGKQTKVVGGPMLSGYELRIDNGVIAVIDILDNTVWMYNELDAFTRLIVSSISSAILLKRIHDVENDTAND